MPKPLAKKVLLIGWDAADWKVIHPLMDAGEMPNLQRLCEQGVMGNLATLNPILSPMLWTSIATGKRPYKHGIHGFTEPDPDTGGIRPITNLSRKTKAIWNILNQNGKRCNVVGWWPSHPAEPINGVMLSNHFQQAVAGLDDPWPMRPGTVHPTRLEEHLRPLRIHPWELEEEHLRPFVPDAANIDQEKDKRLINLAKTLSECSSVHAAATGIMQLEPWDFMAVYLDAIDHFCHGFMKYHPPKQKWINDDDFQMYKDVVAGAYKYHDMMLGTLLALAGDDTTVILMSDHGFHPDHLRPRELPNEPAGPAAEHSPYGVFVMKGPGIKQDERIYGANLLDITPTILQLFGLPSGQDMDGKVLSAAFEATPELDSIESWDKVDGESGEHSLETRVDPVEAREAINQLVALGYIEEPDSDQEVAVDETVRELCYNLARSYMDGNQFGEASRILSELWEKWPDEQRFGVNLLQCYLALDQVDLCRTTLKRIEKRKAQYAAKAAEDLRKLSEELKDVEPESITQQQQRKVVKLRARATTNAKALAYLDACVCQAEGDYQRALDRLADAESAQMHQQPSILQKRGEVYLAMEQWQVADGCFKDLLELDPVNAEAHLGLCRCYLAMRRNRLAAEHALASIGLLYHNPQGHYLHGVALHRCGQIETAVKALEMAVRQNPVFPDAYKRLVYILENRIGDPDRAANYRRLLTKARKRIRNHRKGNTEKLSVTAANAESSRDVRPTEPKKAVVDVNRSMITTQNPTAVDLQQPVIIVSGLPRSGTSMMMQMLDAGGIPVLTDQQREADENNPRGYFEYEPVKSLRRDNAWITGAGGKAVKVISQLVPHLPSNAQYKIILMDRDLGEVIQSQSAMLERLGRKGTNSSIGALSETYARQVAQVQKIGEEHPNIEMMTFHYREAIDNPMETAIHVAQFLDCGLDPVAMAGAVERKLYRQRCDSSMCS